MDTTGGLFISDYQFLCTTSQTVLTHDSGFVWSLVLTQEVDLIKLERQGGWKEYPFYVYCLRGVFVNDNLF